MDFNYMMLSRLQFDCEYVLNCGNGSIRRLFYNSIDEHIEEMKKLYSNFPYDAKPRWISMGDIYRYHEKMKALVK